MTDTAEPTPKPTPETAEAEAPDPAPAKPKKADADDTEAIANPGYHYWHGKVPKGEGAAPAPVPQQVATTSEVTQQMVNIDNFMFLEEDDVIKVYIALEGDLEGATEIIADFERPHYAEYFPLEVAIRGKKQMHVLKAEKLAGSIDCGACKAKVSKKGDKVIITLKKLHKTNWGQLRMNVCLPYRRGGGGS